MEEKSKKDLLQEVISWNRKLEQEKLRLNMRAGQEIFPLLKREQWREWLETRLGGATRSEEIKDFEVLRMPELDQEIVNLILAENPDEIEFLGRMRNVTYRQGYAPYITLEWKEIIERNAWINFSDDECALPSGKVAEIHFHGGYYEQSVKSSKELRQWVRDHLNEEQWNDWRSSEKPAIAAPDVDDETQSIPPVAMNIYGWCVATSIPLYCFGTLYVYGDSNGKISLSDHWYRSQEEAEQQRAAVETRIRECQSERRKKSALAAIPVPSPENLDAEVPEIVEIEGGYGFVRFEESRSYYSGATTISFKVEWTTNRQYASDHREMAVKRLAELQIERREKLELETARAKAAELKVQIENLQQNELAKKVERELSNQLSGMRSRLAYPSGTSAEIKVLLAEAQVVVSQFEQAISSLEKKQKKAREIIRKEYSRCPICGGSVAEIDFEMAEASPNEASSGAVICHCFDDGENERVSSIIQIINNDYYGEQATCSRHDDAVVYSRTMALGGEIILAELLIFYKWGEWNCRLQVYPENFREGVGIRTRKIFKDPSKLSGKVTVAGKPMESSASCLASIETGQEVLTAAIGTFIHHSGKDFRCECGKFASLTGAERKKYQKGGEASISCVCGRGGIVRDGNESIPSEIKKTVSEEAATPLSLAEMLKRAWEEGK